MTKNRLFQYATKKNGRIIIYEDTDLISKKEAHKLWNKYYSQVAAEVEMGQYPQMVIWKNCKNNSDYRIKEKEIDWRDGLEVEDGFIYRIDRVLLK